MADNDDRSVLQVVPDADGKPSLQSLNEVLRAIQMNTYKIEGRLGEATVRDDLRVMGKQTWEGQSTQVGETGSGVIYYDTSLAKFRASQNGAAMGDLIQTSTPTPLSVKVLKATGTPYTTLGTSEETAFTYTLPGGTLAENGDYLEFVTFVQTAANANTKTRSFYFGATANTGSTVVNAGVIIYWFRVFRVTATTQYMSQGSFGDKTANFASASTPAETLANDIVVKWTLTTPTAAGDFTSQYAALSLYRVNPAS